MEQNKETSNYSATSQAAATFYNYYKAYLGTSSFVNP